MTTRSAELQVPKWIATEAQVEVDKEIHYCRVVLRDDQIAHIANAVIERFLNQPFPPQKKS